MKRTFDLTIQKAEAMVLITIVIVSAILLVINGNV